MPMPPTPPVHAAPIRTPTQRDAKPGSPKRQLSDALRDEFEWKATKFVRPEPRRSRSDSPPLHISPLRLSSSSSMSPSPSPPVVQSSPDPEAILQDKLHFVELVLFPTLTWYPFTGGMSAVRRLLTESIGCALRNPTLYSKMVPHELFLQGPAGCGLRTALYTFCKELGLPVSVLKYCAFGNPRESTIEFWNSMYDLAHSRSPCILLVHRISARILHPEARAATLASMRAALFRRNESDQLRMPQVWTVFIDDMSPSKLAYGWNIGPEQTATFSYPPRDERAAALSGVIRGHLLERIPEAACDAQLEAYREQIRCCTEPVSATEELELGGLGAVSAFAKLVFAASLKRQPELAQHSLFYIDPAHRLPQGCDFETARGEGRRRLLVTHGLETGHDLPQRFGVSRPQTREPADPAMDPLGLAI